MDKTTGAATLLCDELEMPGSLAVGGTQLYWFDTDGGVYGHAIDAPGGGPTLQGTTEFSIWNQWNAAISSDGLFWVDDGDPVGAGRWLACR